jgi:plastocyanin
MDRIISASHSHLQLWDVETMNPSHLILCTAVAGILVMAGTAQAQDRTVALTIKDHKFDPAEFEVPAGAKVKLQVKNADATPEEFDSSQLHREKVIPAGQEASIVIGPLKPGRYEFVGEFHKETARGAIVVK